MNQDGTTRHITPSEPPGLSILQRREDDRQVIELRGELDIATCARLRRELREAHTDVGQEIVLDLAGLNFIDSSGVRLLLEVTASTGYGDRSRVLLRRGPENIHRVLRTAGIEDHLPFVD